MVDGDDLAIGPESVRLLAWGDAYRSLRLAGRSGPLAGKDLEVLAASALGPLSRDVRCSALRPFRRQSALGRRQGRAWLAAVGTVPARGLA